MDRKIPSKLGGYLLAQARKLSANGSERSNETLTLAHLSSLNTKNSSITCQSSSKIWRNCSNLRTRIHSGARFVAMRESMANIAGIKVTGSRKLYGRRASSGIFFLISGSIRSPGKCRNLMGELAREPKISFAKRWTIFLLNRLNSLKKNSKKPAQPVGGKSQVKVPR